MDVDKENEDNADSSELPVFNSLMKEVQRKCIYRQRELDEAKRHWNLGRAEAPERAKFY